MTMENGKITPAPQHASRPDQTDGGHPEHVHSDLLWQPREVSAKASVAQYSRFVGRMKIALPAIAGIILLLVLFLPQFRAESEKFRVGVKTLTDITNDTLSMVNARYVGSDDNGRPYTITAVSARERSGEDKSIDLVSPKAALTMSDGSWVNMTATSGVYDRNQQILDLMGKVDVIQQQGYELHSTAARIVVKDRTASGNEPVTGKGSFGTIAASGFTVTDNGSKVNFTGPVTLVLNGHQDKDETAAPGSEAPPPAAEQKKP